MTDAVWALPAGAPSHGLRRFRVDGRNLVDVLDQDSWRSLSAAVDTIATGATTAADCLMLFTNDGRTFEAELDRRHDGLAIHVHDVSRHVDETDRFARLALQLHRRNRDLEVLHDAAIRLSGTLDIQALVDTTATLVASYLDAQDVRVTAAGHESRVVAPVDTDHPAPLTAATLTTARGDLGTVAWWRHTPLSDAENRVLDLIRHHAAVSIDHALLLAPPPADAQRDTHGLLPAATARRRLAGFTRPFAVALIAHDGDVASLAQRVRGGRSGDVKAHWGPRRLLIALEGATEDHLRSWLVQSQVIEDSNATPPWAIGTAVVHHDVDAAIAAADRSLRNRVGDPNGCNGTAHPKAGSGDGSTRRNPQGKARP